VILQHQQSSGRNPPNSPRKSRGLVRSVHQAETVQNDIGLLSRARWQETPVGEQPEPGATVRAAVLRDSVSRAKQAGGGNGAHGIGGLCPQRRWLGALRLRRHRGIRQ
jgi:hypothetical protein